MRVSSLKFVGRSTEIQQFTFRSSSSIRLKTQLAALEENTIIPKWNVMIKMLTKCIHLVQ